MAVLKNVVRRTIKLAERYPWAIPLFGFVSGVASFLMVQRKQDEFGQLLAILMLGSWIWLAMEDLLQRGISHWFHIELPPAVLRFVTQLVHQESLFFVVPFFFITTAWNSGQMVFTSLLISAAFISIIDPLYYHWLAPKRWLYFIFHGVTLFAVLLTALPLIFHLPTPKSYLLALVISALLSLPGITKSLTPTWWKRIPLAIGLMVIICGIGYLARPWIPPASIWLTQVAITDHVDDESRSPNQKLKTVTAAQLSDGIYAYTAIHAPRGLNERIYHQWRHNGKDMDKIPLNINGGREQGYRAWSYKKNFPADSNGDWQIYVVTEAKQVIGVLRFEVVNSLVQEQSPPKSKAASVPASESNNQQQAPASVKQEASASETHAPEPTPASEPEKEITPEPTPEPEAPAATQEPESPEN